MNDTRPATRSRRHIRTPIFGSVVRAAGAWVALVALMWTGAACAGEARAEVPLENVYASPEALVDAVLAALRAEDEEALQAFLISRSEYETALWPEMPDGDYTPFDFFWGMAALGQRKGLGQLINRYGGLDLEVVSITIPDDPDTKESYASFTFHKQVEVVVRRMDTGQEGELPSFDVFLEYGGAWKLANYDEL